MFVRSSLRVVVVLPLALTACVVAPPSGDEYQRALRDPVWNVEPIDAAGLAADVFGNEARAEARYGRSVLRVRGSVAGVSNAGPVVEGRPWKIAITAERAPSGEPRMVCFIGSAEEAGRLSPGDAVVVTGSLSRRFDVIELQDCAVERSGTGIPAGVAPAAVTVAPDFVSAIKVTAEELDAAYSADAAAAATRFGGKPLVVTGIGARSSAGYLTMRGSGFRNVACHDLRLTPLGSEGTRITVRGKVESASFAGVLLWACKLETMASAN